jgi:hypothetical protein
MAQDHPIGYPNSVMILRQNLSNPTHTPYIVLGTPRHLTFTDLIDDRIEIIPAYQMLA